MNSNVSQRRKRWLTGGKERGKFQANKQTCVQATSLVAGGAEPHADLMCGKVILVIRTNGRERNGMLLHAPSLSVLIWYGRRWGHEASRARAAESLLATRHTARAPGAPAALGSTWLNGPI